MHVPFTGGLHFGACHCNLEHMSIANKRQNSQNLLKVWNAFFPGWALLLPYALLTEHVLRNGTGGEVEEEVDMNVTGRNFKRIIVLQIVNDMNYYSVMRLGENGLGKWQVTKYIQGYCVFKVLCLLWIIFR